MQLKDIKVGAPYMFKSSIYGDTAVHVTSIYNDIVHFTIDGAEASRQVQDFPVLKGGYFAIASRIERKAAPVRVRDASAEKALAQAAGIINSTIREVPGVGKVAVVTTSPALQKHIEKASKPLSAVLATKPHYLDNLTIAQLKAYAKEIGMSTGTKLTRKAELKAAIVAFLHEPDTSEVTF